MLAGPLDKGRRLAAGVAAPVHVVCDAGHAAGRRMRDYAAFGDPDSARNALLVECGAALVSRHGARPPSRSRYGSWPARAPWRAEWIEARLPRTAAHRPVSATGHRSDRPVTIETDRFRFAKDYRGMEVIPEQGAVIGWDGDREIRTPYPDCVLIMPSRSPCRGESAVRFGRYTG